MSYFWPIRPIWPFPRLYGNPVRRALSNSALRVRARRKYRKKTLRKFFLSIFINLYSCDILCDTLPLVWQHLWRFNSTSCHTFELTLLEKITVTKLFYITCCFWLRKKNSLSLFLNWIWRREVPIEEDLLEEKNV